MKKGHEERGYILNPTEKTTNPNYHGQINYSNQLIKTSFLKKFMYMDCLSLKMRIKSSSLDMGKIRVFTVQE